MRDTALYPVFGDHYIMARRHRQAVMASLQRSARGIMLEWGTGASTAWFLLNKGSGQRLISVEHDLLYLSYLMRGLADTRGVAVERITLGWTVIPVPCNVLMDNTDAEERTRSGDQTMYTNIPETVESNMSELQTVLVDGVLRASCLAALAQTLHADSPVDVFLHDSQRSWYADEVERSGHWKIEERYPSESDYPGPEMVRLRRA